MPNALDYLKVLSSENLAPEFQEGHPDARLLIHDGHLHARFPGWYGAPVLGGAKAAGLRNPMAVR